MCKGLYQHTITAGGKSFSMRHLQTMYTQGINKLGDVLWYSVPLETIITDQGEFHGTIRSTKCMKNKGQLLPSGTCLECNDLLQTQEMKMRIRRGQKTDDSTSFPRCKSTPNKNLTETEKDVKLKVYKARNKRQRILLVRLAQKLALVQSRKKKLSEKIAEYTNRGDTSACIENIKRAHEQGCLSGSSKTLKFLKDITANMTKHGRGKRYGKFTKQLYDVLRIMGGPRSSCLIAQNLFGPSRKTQNRSRSKHCFKYKPSLSIDSQMQQVASIYRDIMSSKNITGPILVETAEDETVIISQVMWDSSSDECWGWCGRSGAGHECDHIFTYIVGDGPDAYERLQEAFRENKIAGLARVVMLNPLHKELPALVILLQATCNTFTHVMVREQWQEIARSYNQYLFDILGPLIGHASDGDSRRRKLHLQDALAQDGDRYRIDTDNFMMSGKLTVVNGQKTLSDLSDQDFVHCGKKLINHLKHPSRVLSIGGNVAHMHHLQLVLDRFGRLEHGLQQSDVDRQDRMDWNSAQRLMFPQVRDCLDKINRGDGVEKENVLGTLLYLRNCWRFTEIYLSLVASLSERIMYASCVVNFLRIWRLWVHKTGQLTLKQNFVSRESFQDISLACHHAVLIIRAARDFAPNQAVCLERTGTDVCEDYFSANGSFILNKHNYTIMDMFKNLGNMHRFQEILADPEGPDYVHAAKRKGENIWYKGNPNVPEVAPQMNAFPTDEEMVKEWEKGLELAQMELREAGIQPVNEDQLDPDNRWFFQPHLLTGVTDAQLDADGLYADGDEIYPAAQHNDVRVHIGGHQEDGDGADLNAPPQTLDASGDIELRAHFSQVADDIDRNSGTTDAEQESASDTTVQVAHTLNVPGYGAVHKSTIVAKLNSCPNGNLTWDRTLRVRYGKVSSENISNIESYNQVGLFDDVALYIKDQRSPPEWKLGRVIRMRNKERTTVEYIHPVNIQDTRKYPKLYFMVNMYSKNDNTFAYHSNSQPAEFNVSSVIMKVSLTFKDEAGGTYSLDDGDRQKLEDFKASVSATRPIRRNQRNLEISQQETAVSGEGRVVVEVLPTPHVPGGPRTSSRKRRQRIYID